VTQTILSAISMLRGASSCYGEVLAGRIACVTRATRRRPFWDRRLFPNRSETSGKLVLHCVVQLFPGVLHVLMRFFDRIEFLLLISIQHWPNLR